MSNKRDRLIALLEPEAKKYELDLVDIEIAGTAKNPILRVFLDKPGLGIDLDELKLAQRWVDEIVEVQDPFPNSYVLEVSSPGIDRHLRKESDFNMFTGEDVCVYLKKGYTPAKLNGKLLGYKDSNVIIETDCQTFNIAFDSIKKAHIIGKIDFNKSFQGES